MKNEDRIRSATSFIIIGLILFIIGLFDNRISNLFHKLNDDIRVYGWGWIPQLIGGLLVIYGIMIIFQEYTKFRNQLSYSGPPSPYPPFTLFFMDKEMKKLIWLLLIVILVIFLLSPRLICLTFSYVLSIVLILLLIILLVMLEQRLHFLFPPPYYPPPPQMPYKSPPTPSKNGKIIICKRCRRPLEPNWVVCPFCGESVSDKN